MRSLHRVLVAEIAIVKTSGPSLRPTFGWSAVETQCPHLRCSHRLRYRRPLERRLRRVEPGRQSERAGKVSASRQSSSSIAGTRSTGRDGATRDGFRRRAGSESTGRDTARHAGGAFRIQRQHVAKGSGRCRPRLDVSARRQCSLVGPARRFCQNRNVLCGARALPRAQVSLRDSGSLGPPSGSILS
jgi:hypothetical protein